MNKRINSSRGQTSVDYIIAIGLFFITLAILIGTSSFLINPDISTSENKSISQSVTNKLTENVLKHPDTTKYTLSRECTVLFFETMQSNSIPEHTPDWCSISSTNVNSELNIKGAKNVSISIQDTSQNPVTLDETDLEINPDLPDQADISTTTKQIYIDDNLYTMKVYVW